MCPNGMPIVEKSLFGRVRVVGWNTGQYSGHGRKSSSGGKVVYLGYPLPSRARGRVLQGGRVRWRARGHGTRTRPLGKAAVPRAGGMSRACRGLGGCNAAAGGRVQWPSGLGGCKKARSGWVLWPLLPKVTTIASKLSLILAKLLLRALRLPPVLLKLFSILLKTGLAGSRLFQF